ncbi:MAG: LytTR family transcriptional regulator DNA-binding domain-containing protein [Clostridia bacterium]|nr:LytTR family transcriptional regulator DNA-binding domain-containing protein [Clostridia bacterium]
MKKPSIRFERDPSLSQIEVVIRAPEQDDAVIALMERISGQPPDMLTAFDGDGIIVTVNAEDIISASADGRLVSLVTTDGCWYTRQTLQSLEEMLDSRRFLRISRFEIINLRHVLRYDFTVAGTLRIELAGGMETWASRRCIPAIRRRLTGKE